MSFPTGWAVKLCKDQTAKAIQHDDVSEILEVILRWRSEIFYTFSHALGISINQEMPTDK